MIKLEKRKVIIIGILSFLLNFMLISGWQLSMDYGSSFFQSEFIQNIGVLATWQCILIGAIQWPSLFALFYFLFHKLEMRGSIAGMDKPFIPARFVGPVAFIALYAIWLLFLWGCYPGYYNYDAGHQLPQFMYEQVQYGAHHPLLHTLFEGSLITLGYKIDSTDLTLGVFLYNAVQMFICSASLSYSVHFIYKRTRNRVLTVCSFIFYALCPPIVMFAMSTTKDVPCYSMLLVAFLLLWELFEKLEASEQIRFRNWLIIGVFLTLACLFRRNIIYAFLIFAVFSVIFMKKERKKQILLYISVFLVYNAIDTGLLHALDATPASINEALCVPYQQIARLYNEEGLDAFTEEEYEFLSEIVPLESLTCYDPVMADYSKAIFNAGLDTLKEYKWDYLLLWLKKGIQYPQVYIESFLYNTYQAWYPATLLFERIKLRYFDIANWQYEFGTPHWQGLFDYYEGVANNSYAQYPIVRLFFSTGTMFFSFIIAWFYSIWHKQKDSTLSLLLILLVCATSLCGPVSDIRYYLILFYLLPICFSILARRKS